MASPKSVPKSNNKSTKAKAQPKAAIKASGTARRKTLAMLNEEAGLLPPLIRPQYTEFATPSGQDVIIKKIPIGLRDQIVVESTVHNELDFSLLCQYAIFHSLVEPKLSLENVNLIQPEDFDIIWKEISDFSYGKVGEVVERFRKSTA